MSYAEVQTSTDPNGIPVLTVTVRWTEVSPAGVTMRIYAVTACLTKKDQAPCVVAGMTIPAKDKVLLQSVAAVTGTVHWESTHEDIGGALSVDDTTNTIYDAIILVVSNEHGTARFVVAASSTSCVGCTY